MSHFHLPLSLISLSILAGCASQGLIQKYDGDTNDARNRMQDLVTKQVVPQSNAVANAGSTFSEKTPSMPAIAIKPLSKPLQAAQEKKWLTSIDGITLDPAKNTAVPAPAIIRMLRAKGINIVSHVPLDMYSYNGFGVTNVNAETALMVFLGAMGLDFELDNARQLVIVQPLKARTWQLDIGNRRTSFTAGNNTSNSNTTNTTNGTAGTAGSPYGTSTLASGLSASTGTSVSPLGTSTSSNSNSTNTNDNTISASDDVWGRLQVELTERLTVPFPRSNLADPANAGNPAVPSLSGAPGTPPGANGMPGQSMATYYNMMRVGTVSINPETGAVTVRAPRYLMDTLDTYMKSVIRRYNTLITFEAEIISLTSSQNISEGLDWTAFNTFNNGSYTSIAQNSILGGAVITPAAGTSAVVDLLSVANAAAVPGANALFGVVSTSKKFAAINAYLGTVGKLSIKDTPVISTTSGAPVKLNNTTLRYYQQYQQVAAPGGTGSAAVATNTIDVPFETGITIRINPTYNPETGIINCLFSIDRKTLQGYQDKINPITNGNSIQSLTTRTPIINSTNQNGNLVLRDGAFVVVGGLTEDMVDDSQTGIPGFMDTPIKGLTGKELKNRTKTTYYVALRVTTLDPTAMADHPGFASASPAALPAEAQQ